MKIVLVTFYDPYANGSQILSGIAKREGAEVTFINVRDAPESSIGSPVRGSGLYQTVSGGRGWRVKHSINESDLQSTADFIRDINPDIVGISTRSITLEYGGMLAKMLKFQIIAGGWGPTLEPEKAMEWADYVCFGEGDYTMSEIAKGTPLNEIGNLHSKNKPLSFVYPPLSSEDLEMLHRPDHGIDGKYNVEDGVVSPVTANNFPHILVSRGCPMHCSYCMSGQYRALYNAYTNHKFPSHRIRSVGLVIKELIEYPSDYSFVVFQDEIFPWDKDWLDEFCIRYPAEVGQPFFAHVRPEFHNQETIKALVRAGMTESGIGLQSASIEILKGVYNRHLLPNQALKMAETLTDLGVSFPYHVLVDNPFETEIDMRLTLDWLWEAPSQNTTVMYLTSFPLSPLGKRIQEENPEYLPAHLISWYAWLMSLASGRRLKKRLTKVVFFMGIFKKHPGFLYFVWNFVLRLAEWGRNVTK